MKTSKEINIAGRTYTVFECQECGAEGSAATDMDLVAEFCPFCGEPLDNIDWEEDYENFNSESEGT